MSRGASSILPPAPSALHTTQSTRLDQLLGALSPKHPAAAKVTSPHKQGSPRARGSPQTSHGLTSPSRFTARPSRMSPQHARCAGSSMLSPGKHKSAQRSLLRLTQQQPIQADMLSPGRHKPAQPSLLSPDQHRRPQDGSSSQGRHRPVQRSLLSPERKRAVRNLRSPCHAKAQADNQACAAESSHAVTGVTQHSGFDNDKLEIGQQVQPAAAPWGPRPGSATFSSTLPIKPAGANQQQAPSPSPFAFVAQQQHGSDTMLDQEQSGSHASGLCARPQSASFSNEMLQQHATDKPVSKLMLEQHSMPEQTSPAAAASSGAATAQDKLDSPPASPSAAQPASLTAPHLAAAAEAASTAFNAEAVAEPAALAEDILLSGTGAADRRLNSAFAHVADLDLLGDWQSVRRAEAPEAEQPYCVDKNGVDPRVLCSVPCPHKCVLKAPSDLFLSL